MAQANNQKITVELNRADRQLLKQLIKALNANHRKSGPIYCGNGPESGPEPRRLVESEVTVSGSDFGDPAYLDNHIEADVKGYTWNGHGWVPKGGVN